MTRISLLLADVDGTLVTSDKRLTPTSRAAVRKLADAGIAFTVTSSRPPFGLRMLAAPLDLQLPVGAFNGGALVTPDMRPIEQHTIAPDAARRAIAIIEECGADVWLFTGSRWLLRNPEGAYVDHERRTIDADPTIVASFDPHLDHVGKIVGVSRDFARLAACEPLARAALPDASVVRSQNYYLDVTPAGVDKGTVVDALSRLLGIPHEEIATIGDMENDVPMFRKSGFRIAMGNATDEVKREADVATLSNNEDGFAAAVEKYVLPMAHPHS
jgi:hypothetical protein